MTKTLWKPLAGMLVFFAISTAQAANLKDDEIVAVVSTANIAEINAAKLATANASNTKVKDFAEHMIKDHKDMDAQMGQLAVKLKLNPTPSDKSESMKSEANADLQKLKATPKGLTFDKQYIESQVKDHQKVLELVQNELIPSARNDQLKSLLQKSGKKIADHLKQAQQLQTELSGNH